MEVFASLCLTVGLLLMERICCEQILYINPCHAECIKMPHPFLIFSQFRLLYPDYWHKYTYLMANSVDPDQLASSEAKWSGSTLFAKAGYIRIQQD